MLPELKYLQVNWIDGMKIAEDHLHQLNSSTQDLTRDAITISLNNYNYGLVNPVSESEKAYPSEWSDVNACQFESVLMDVIRTEYNHLDISESLAPASRMLSMFHVLFGKLS